MSDHDDAMAVLADLVPIGTDHPVVQTMGGAIVQRAAERPAPAPAPSLTDEQVAQLFHDTYEALAPIFDYRTREQTAVPWADVPEPNRSLMIAVAGVVAKRIRGDSP